MTRGEKLRRGIRWQAATSLLFVLVASALLVYQGAVLTRVDLWGIGGAIFVLAALALLSGREPDEQDIQVES